MKIQIQNKIPKVIGSDSIIKDNNDYAVTIYPDDEWKNKTITAVIVADTTAQYPSVILSNNTFTLPTVTGNISKLYVGFIAGELKTTAPVVIEVSQSIRDYTGGTPVSPPSATVYETIIAKLDAAMLIASEAKGYRDSAQGYASNASTSATNASQSATTASNKATEAQGYASTASEKASSASQSEASASQSEASASTSASQASASATSAQASAQTASQKAAESKQDYTELSGAVSRINVDLEELESEVDGKASTESVQNLNASKLSKPTSGIAVGKYFKVASIDSEGNPVLEACELPVASIVKSGMTSATDPAWTASEQLNARQRMGLDKEWVLKGEIVGDETDRGNIDTGVSVDLSGCTELMVRGDGIFTSATSISSSQGVLSNLLLSSTYPACHMVWRDGLYGLEPVVFVKGTNMNNLGVTANSYAKTITTANINKIKLVGTITSCNIQIYAR